MLVAFRVEFGDDGKAVVGLLSEVIGSIATVKGCCTIRRASGVAVQVSPGDPICQEDVIETAADGRIGICFLDGTVFDLFPGTRLALSEFVCDANGTSHSPLVAVTGGTFAFKAGRMAEASRLTVDTLFGSVRGRAHSGGFGMLGLTALTLSMLGEVRAADPDVTILDDDRIAYKDLEFGVLELTTKEPIPKFIRVEDPEKTIVLHQQERGSSVSVNQVTNSAARMEELQAAQRDVLANYAQGIGGTGSGTPPSSVNSSPVQRINYSPADLPTLQNSSPAPLLTLTAVPEIITGQPPPEPPALTVAAGPTEIDTVAFDQFTATSGTFHASSSNSGTLTYGIDGGAAGSTILDGVTYDLSRTGPFGTLYLNSTSGAFSFVPDGGAINALTATTITSFTVTVSDGTLSASRTFPITINGVNDAAVISGTTAGAVIEAGVATSGAPTTTGTLTDTDVDNPFNTFTAVGPTPSAHGYGSFAMTAAGVWSYTLNNANGAVQALNAGGILSDSFTVTTVDGTPQVVSITITGSNDSAVITGTTTGAVTETGSATPGTPTATGTLIDTDLDNPFNTFTAVGPTPSAQGYGSFAMTAAGVWTYTLDNANSAVQALNAGGILSDSFTVTTVDGTSQVVTITITGSNDSAVITGTTSGAVTETGSATPGTPTATGTLTDADLDNPFNTFTAVGPTPSAQGYGSFAMTAAGVWSYTLDNGNSTVQALNAGGFLTDSFTVTTVDGTSQVVTITITGSNDSAVITGTTTGAVTETGSATPGIPTATGTLIDADLDNPFNTFTAVGPTPSAQGYGSFAMTAAGVWTYTLDNANSAVQALNAGGILTDSFTVTTVDGTPQVVTITITGSNDSAVITGTTTGAVTETGSATPGTPTATGTLVNADLDNPANTFTAVGPTPSAQGYGNFAITAAGVWSYTLNNANSAVQALNAGNTLSDSFTVTTVDGTPQVVTITITGSNDAAIITGTTTGAVTETGSATPGIPTATGTLVDADLDNPANTFTAVGPTPSAQGYGSFTMTAAGVWSYTLDNANGAVQALNAGSILNDSFTVTTVDGTPQVVTITITGSNDSAVITGTTTGAVTETGSATPGIPTATGTLFDTDVDNPFNTFTAVGPTPSAQGYGSFTMTAAGVWSYTLDNANSTVQALNAGGVLSDSFTVTTVDGTPQLVSITITGSNDAAIITGTTTGAVTETGSATPGTPTATGTLIDTDLDNPANTFTAVGPTPSAQGYGSFAMTAAGVWTYTLDNANGAVQALNAGNTLSDSFTVTTVDGTPQVVSITITGSNDSAIITGTTTGAVTETGSATPGTPTATGTLTDADLDNPFNTFTAVGPTPSAQGYGSFAMTAAGVWTYTLDNANSAVQALNAGGVLSDSFTVTTVDGTPQVVTVTITGSNDSAVITGTTTGSVTETGSATPGTPTATGTLFDTDVDNPFNAFIPVSSPTPSASGYGSFTMTAVGMWIYMLDNANSAVENLNSGDTLTDSFTVTTVDGTPQVVSITIHGATDADINDFDALATRATVTTEPPFVYGTTGSDSIAGGGNDGQTVYGGAGGDTINGTGQEDTIFSGSGNDTVKGNGGNDTIFGGSGIDTINGNNGDDTIVGGFGADNLTGSNGGDRFVYLSVADSNATRFDTITDFSSGSDRIDLTALGAFALLALTSASTSVPPHTIAWIHDSATNQTIVYVNPTDQPLSIGSSALLEIHLQGVVAVASTDFVFAAEAAFASAAGEPVNLELAATAETDGAVVAMASADGIVDAADAKMQTGDLDFSPDADRDRPDSLPDSGHARIVSFGEDRTQPTEVNENNIVVTAESGQPVVPHHLHFAEPTEFRFVFDPVPAPDKTSAMTATDDPGGAIHHASITAPDAPGDIAELQPDVPGQGSEVGSGGAPPNNHGNIGSQVNSAATPNEDNLGLPEVSVNHGQAVASLVANSGEPPAHGNNSHSIPGDAGEHGSNPSHGAPPSNAHGISGTAGTPGQGDSFQFNHAMAGSESGSGNAPSHSHGNNGSQTNPTIALNDDNLGVPEVSGNHGQAVASMVANSAEPPAHGNNNHSIPGDASEQGSNPSHGAPPSNAHGMSGAAGTPGPGDSFQFNHATAGSKSDGGNAPSHSHGNGSQMNSTVALNEDNSGIAEIRGNQGPTVASPDANAEESPTNANNPSIPGDEHGAAQSHGAPSSNPHGLAHSAAAGTPGPGNSFQFNHEIAGSVSSDIIELASLDLDPAPASTGRHANAAGNGQPEESQITELSLPGNPADHFHGHPGNTHVQHDLMV